MANNAFNSGNGVHGSGGSMIAKNFGAEVFRQSQLLILAETDYYDIITLSTILGYEKYSVINSYFEDFSIVQNQNLGSRGINISNLVINMPRNAVSVKFFNTFWKQTTFRRIEIVKINNNSIKLEPILQEKICYGMCKIQTYNNKNDMHVSAIEMQIRYNSRANEYKEYVDGKEVGKVLSVF